MDLYELTLMEFQYSLSENKCIYVFSGNTPYYVGAGFKMFTETGKIKLSRNFLKSLLEDVPMHVNITVNYIKMGSKCICSEKMCAN